MSRAVPLRGSCRGVSRRLAAALVIAAAAEAHAGRTLTWSESPEQLARGQAEAMALTGRGRLFLAPRLIASSGARALEGPAQVWSAASDGRGRVYLGSGPAGQILALEGSGEPRLFFTVDEPLVTALALAPDGQLLAGTSPGGGIYRISPDGSGSLWTVVDELYVWALAIGEDGQVWAGTGERGRVLAIGPTGSVEGVFDSDEPHVFSLLPLPDGGMLAGGSGRGLVYRIDAEGHAFVVHDDDLPQVVALASDADGALWAALVGPKETAARRPALKLRLPDGVQVGASDEAVATTLEERRGPTLHGTIDGLGATPEQPRAPRVLGRIVRIDDAGRAAEAWRSTSAIPFCLAADDEGRILFGTGEPARLHRIEPDGDVALLATLREAQLTALMPVSGAVVLATSSPASVYRLEAESAESGAFVSRPFDAGGPARWGAIRWRVDHPSGRTEIYTRTGNTQEPDASWSAWSPALTEPQTSTVVNTDGRFLQWRARQLGSPDPLTRIEGVSVAYQPYNRPPSAGGLAADPVAPGSGSQRTFRCAVSDQDGDLVELALEYRPAGGAEWSRAAIGPAVPSSDPQRSVAWDTAAVPEGWYEVRAVVSDQSDNPPGEGFSALAPEVVRVVVDRSPPQLDVLPAAGGAITVGAEDLLSDIRRVEILDRGTLRSTLRSVDGLCDSPRETFEVELPPAGAEGWSVRCIDAAGNSSERDLAAGPPSE